MKFSIIVPVYNAEKYIGRCVSSILKQSYNDYEIIVVNDGSTDNTIEELNKFKDSKIKIISIENSGVSNSRNIGLDLATGDIIGFVDADDYIDSELLEIVNRTFCTNDVQLVVCSFKGNDKKANEKKYYTGHEMIYETIDGNLFKGFVWNKFFTAALINKNLIRFRNNIHMCEDMLFCLEYMQHIEKGIYIDRELYSYEISESSITHNRFNLKRLTVLDAYSEILKLQAFKESDVLRELIINRRVRNCLALWFSSRMDSNVNTRKLVKSNILPVLSEHNTFLKSRRYSFKEKVMYIVVKMVIRIYV